MVSARGGRQQLNLNAWQTLIIARHILAVHLFLVVSSRSLLKFQQILRFSMKLALACVVGLDSPERKSRTLESYKQQRSDPESVGGKFRRLKHAQKWA